MAWTDGVFRAQYEVHCRACDIPLLGLGPNLADAQAEAVKRYGWKCIGRKWFCGACVENRSRSQLMTIARRAP